ncbi:MAG TPA: formate/nitrite transporter family protein [Terriglobales bacterium]
MKLRKAALGHTTVQSHHLILLIANRIWIIKSTEKMQEIETQRRSAEEIYKGALDNARDELNRTSRALAFSGFAGGITMGLTGLAVAAARNAMPESPSRELVGFLFYPIGFIAVILGRAQLFTENTLFPVVLVFDERRHLLNTLRLWIVVFVSNIAGAFLFGFLAARTGALQAGVLTQITELGKSASQGNFGHVFWSGVLGGWIIALVAWLVTASHWTIGQVLVTWLLTFVVGAAHLSHCIASSGEILTAVFANSLPLGHYVHWLFPATLGNIVGGVVIVSVLNYGQVRAT